ncbi:MAG: peptide chain release factor N(5)-glutamine methyltransferase [Pseudomonadota bacterium]
MSAEGRKETRTLRTVVRGLAQSLKESGIPSPGLEAHLLAATVLDVSREEVLRAYDQEISYEALMKIEGLAERRSRGEPMAYIRGLKEFWSLAFKVDRRVMIPRPETELLVDRCLRHAREKARGRRLLALDVGTGSGAVACAFAAELEDALIIASDVSRDALAVARENAGKLGLDHKIRFVLGGLLEPFRAGCDFDIMAANLPYIPSGRLPLLPEGIRDYEPGLALDGGADGLEVIRTLVASARGHVGDGGILALEVEDDQVDMVIAMLKAAGGFGTIGIDVDTAGFKRVVWAEKGGFGP